MVVSRTTSVAIFYFYFFAKVIQCRTLFDKEVDAWSEEPLRIRQLLDEVKNLTRLKNILVLATMKNARPP